MDAEIVLLDQQRCWLSVVRRIRLHSHILCWAGGPVGRAGMGFCRVFSTFAALAGPPPHSNPPRATGRHTSSSQAPLTSQRAVRDEQQEETLSRGEPLRRFLPRFVAVVAGRRSFRLIVSCRHERDEILNADPTPLCLFCGIGR